MWIQFESMTDQYVALEKLDCKSCTSNIRGSARWSDASGGVERESGGGRAGAKADGRGGSVADAVGLEGNHDIFWLPTTFASHSKWNKTDNKQTFRHRSWTARP
jgi:hypothetical protein